MTRQSVLYNDMLEPCPELSFLCKSPIDFQSVFCRNIMADPLHKRDYKGRKHYTEQLHLPLRHTVLEIAVFPTVPFYKAYSIFLYVTARKTEILLHPFDCMHLALRMGE